MCILFIFVEEYPYNLFSLYVHFILAFKILCAVVFLLQSHPEIVSQLVDLIGITSIMEVSLLQSYLPHLSVVPTLKKHPVGLHASDTLSILCVLSKIN